MKLFEIDQTVERPQRYDEDALKELHRKIELAEDECDWKEQEYLEAQCYLEDLYIQRNEIENNLDIWPDKQTLLAVYGAPGNWPVVAIDA